MAGTAELARRAAPAVAVCGAALAFVALVDPALGGASATTAAVTTPTADAAVATCSDATTVTGTAVMTRYGPVQVAAQVAGGSLCSVRAVVWPDGDHRSAQINATAIPILDRSASTAGLDFDAVTGATYTSQGYRTSLQSIVDQL